LLTTEDHLRKNAQIFQQKKSEAELDERQKAKLEKELQIKGDS